MSVLYVAQNAVNRGLGSNEGGFVVLPIPHDAVKISVQKPKPVELQMPKAIKGRRVCLCEIVGEALIAPAFEPRAQSRFHFVVVLSHV
jgi:hypothetical protein